MTERITKSMAKNIYYGGGTFALLIFLALTFDTVHQIPERSNEVNMTASVVAGIKPLTKQSNNYAKKCYNVGWKKEMQEN